jgi:acetolactate synthase regulatory subunit
VIIKKKALKWAFLKKRRIVMIFVFFIKHKSNNIDELKESFSKLIDYDFIEVEELNNDVKAIILYEFDVIIKNNIESVEKEFKVLDYRIFQDISSYEMDSDLWNIEFVRPEIWETDKTKS